MNFFQKIYAPIQSLSQLKSAFGSPFFFYPSTLSLASLILFCDQFYMYTFHRWPNQELLSDKLNNMPKSLSSLISSAVWNHSSSQYSSGICWPAYLLYCYFPGPCACVAGWWVRRKGSPKSADYGAVVIFLKEYKVPGQDTGLGGC